MTQENLEKELNFLKKIYRDIILGYSSYEFKNQTIYFKHPKDLDIFICSEVYLKEYNKAIKVGLPSEKVKLKILHDTECWSLDKDKEIDSLKKEIDNLKITKNKLIIRSQINDFENKIKLNQKKLDELLNQKKNELGLTAETFALKKSNEYILYVLMHKNPREKFFNTELDFLELDVEKLTEFFYLYKDYIEEFSSKNLKKIAASYLFMNNFLMSEDNIYSFYGKPILELTQYQIDLYSFGKIFKNILIKSKCPPPDIFESFDDLVSWYENFGTNFDNKNKDGSSDGKTYIGASKKELKEMTPKDGREVIDLVEEAEKIGKNLTFNDILKIHGEI